VGAYRWEHRLPRSVRWVSHPTSRLTTADRFRGIEILADHAAREVSVKSMQFFIGGRVRTWQES
jgi:hypothetical protein